MIMCCTCQRRVQLASPDLGQLQLQTRKVATGIKQLDLLRALRISINRPHLNSLFMGQQQPKMHLG